MTYVLYILAALLVLDALRLRGRIAGLDMLADRDEPATHVALAAPGIALHDATLRAASAYMRARSLDVLDLVPRDVPSLRALAVAQLVDPARYPNERLAPGRTAGHALVVSHDVLARAGLAADAPAADAAAFAKLAVHLPYYGARGVAIAPHEHAAPADLTTRLLVLRAQLGPSTSVGLGAILGLLALFAIGTALRPLPGLVAIAAWQLQPAIALVASKLAPRDLALVTVLRAPIELYILCRTFAGAGSAHARAAALRDDYARAIAAGTAALFEPRRETCPLCDSRDLHVHLRNARSAPAQAGRVHARALRRRAATSSRTRGCRSPASTSTTATSTTASARTVWSSCSASRSSRTCRARAW